MNISEIIAFNTQIIFILLSLIAIVDYIRHRDPRRRDFALMATALGFPFALVLLRNLQLFQSGALDLAGAFVLFSQPYFLFRLLQYFRPSRPRIGIIIVVGFLLSCALLWFRMVSNPALTVVLIFGYCAVVEAYCTLGFYRGMQATVGTLRRRLWIITLSSAVFTLAFVINVIKAQFPIIAPVTTPIAQIASAVSAVFFYVAFVPPRGQRLAWQMEELRDYLLQTRIAPASEAFVSDNFRQLSQGAKQATNGMAGGVLRLNESANEWDILAATDQALFASLIQNGQRFINQGWQHRQTMSRSLPDIADADERRQLRTLGAQTWLLVPIHNQERSWGLLIVALRDRSLFIDDDLKILELLVRECILVLDNHRLIDELQDYSGQLEHKVEERTAALQRSNEELRRYAYVASHDLQEPLRTVTSYLQLIEQRFPDKLNEEGREFIKFAVDGALRMKNLIQDLLMYSRVESRSHTFTLLDMQEVLDKTIQFLEVMLAETDAHITHDNLPKIIADEELMIQLFQNLIENAIKYRSAKKPEIHIGATCKDQHWVFSVRDNGIGIEQQYLEQIFIIFKRLHIADEYPGTGIGLAVCKKAVELHDGRIWAESEVGQGTTFHFTIPIRELAS